MAKKKPRKRTPDKQAKSGAAKRTPTGQFLPGVSGNPAGRPRGIDFRRLVRGKTKDNGSLEEGLFAVYRTLLRLAKGEGRKA